MGMIPAKLPSGEMVRVKVPDDWSRDQISDFMKNQFGKIASDRQSSMSATPENAMALARKQIDEQYPGMPDFLKEALLKITPREESPMLASAARGVGNVTNFIPAIAGGALQGASIPIRGIAGLIPGETAEKFANSPDLTELFPQDLTPLQHAAQTGSELVGAGGAFGKLMQGTGALAKAARVPKMLQGPAALTGAASLGTPGDAGDRALATGGALALGGAGKVAQKAAEKVPEFMSGLFNSSTPELLAESVQKPHDVLQSSANELYGQVRNAIKNRNIQTPINPEIIEQVKEYFPKNARSYKDLLERAQNGDYEAIHKIQSSLYKKGTKAISSDDLAMENQGEDILDLREKINEELNNHLIQGGHLDIAHVLSQGRKLYSELQNTYFPKNLKKAIGKMVHPDIRHVPENVEKIFTENSKPMREFLERHPEVAKHVQNLVKKNKAQKRLNSLIMKGGGAGVATLAGKTIYDLFK